jgi:hypothetical protein
VEEKMEKTVILIKLREAIMVFVMVLLAYGYFSFGSNDWNVNSRLALVKAFVENGVFEIDAYHETRELGTNDKAYYNGHYYSDKAIGSSVSGAIAYYPIHWLYLLSGVPLSVHVFRELLTFIAVGLPAAFMAPFIFLLIRYITGSSIRGLFITLGIALGAPLFKYSTGYYGHSLAATALFFGFLIWFHARREKFASPQLAFVSAILFGFMVITEYPTVILLALVSPYILYTLYESGQLFDWKIYTAMAVGFMLPVCLVLYYNQSVFGSLFASGYSHEAREAFKSAHEQNLMGIGLPNLYNVWYQTFQPAFGIFWQSPILLLAFPGWFLMFRSREYRLEAGLSLVLIFSYILLFSGYYMWWGGQAFGPRHLIPILPIFALPLAFIPEKFLIPLALTTLVSVFQNLLLTASGTEGLGAYINTHLRPAWDAGGIRQPYGMLVYDVALPNVLQGNLANNRGIDYLGLYGPASLLPWFLLEAGLLLACLKLISGRTDRVEVTRQ